MNCFRNLRRCERERDKFNCKGKAMRSIKELIDRSRSYNRPVLIAPTRNCYKQLHYYYTSRSCRHNNHILYAIKIYWYYYVSWSSSVYREKQVFLIEHRIFSPVSVTKVLIEVACKV